MKKNGFDLDLKKFKGFGFGFKSFFKDLTPTLLEVAKNVSVVSTDYSLMLLGSYLCELTYVAIDCEFGIWLIVEVLLYFSYVGPSIWTCELLIWVTWPPLVHS